MNLDFSSRTQVVLDTCALFGQLPRDLLLSLAEKELYIPVWSNLIEDELSGSLFRVHKRHGYDDAEARDMVKSLFKALDTSFPYACKHLEPEQIDPYRDCLPTDTADAHIVALAVATHTSIIVTYNTRDFPLEALPLGVKAIHPDSFLSFLADQYPEAVIGTVQQIATRRQQYTEEYGLSKDFVELLSIQHPTFTSKISELLEPGTGLFPSYDSPDIALGNDIGM